METISRKLKSGESLLDFCRECKCLIYEDEGEATICLPCMVRLTRGKFFNRKAKKESK